MTESKRISKQNKFGDSKRFYETPNGTYASVTTILSAIGKPALINWAAKVERELVTQVSADLYEDCPSNPRMSRTGWITSMQSRMTKEKAHQRELAKAGEIGSQVHALIEWGLKAELFMEAGPSPIICDKAQWAYAAFQDWRKSVTLKPIFVEQMVWNDEYGYAGTLDLLAEVEGKLTVLDWKTSKALYPECALQNVAYRKAVRSMGHGDPQQGIIVRFPKNETDPGFEVKVIDGPSEEPLFKTFLAVMDVWKWQQEQEAAREEKLATGTPEHAIEATLQQSLEGQGASAA